MSSLHCVCANVCILGNQQKNLIGARTYTLYSFLSLSSVLFWIVFAFLLSCTSPGLESKHVPKISVANDNSSSVLYGLQAILRPHLQTHTVFVKRLFFRLFVFLLVYGAISFIPIAFWRPITTADYHQLYDIDTTITAADRRWAASVCPPAHNFRPDLSRFFDVQPSSVDDNFDHSFAILICP